MFEKRVAEREGEGRGEEEGTYVMVCWEGEG